ncbi:MAG: ATP-binding protein [Eubacteriales bacterium]|nr:ATP-binding protein [Eubacteriales bacterium]
MRDLSLHLMDIVQNSVKAKASEIEILIEVSPETDQMIIFVGDNGSGMQPDMVEKVQDPFVTSRTTRSVGLGIPLLKELCELTGGQLQLASTLGVGTRLTAILGLSSIDRLPLGAIGDTMMVLISADPSLNYTLAFRAPGRFFELRLQDVRAEIPDLPLDEPSVLQWLKEYIAEQQQAVFTSYLDE